MPEANIDFSEKLKELSQIDIRSIDPKDLVDIKDVTICEDLPIPERVLDYIQQIKNPYCYLCNGVVVRISFAGKSKLSDCLKTALFPGIE